MAGDTDGRGAEGAINKDANGLDVGGLDAKASAWIKRHGKAGDAK